MRQNQNKDIERAAQYRREASVCATAAATSAIAEIKQAYLELEQGWLCLAPKTETNPADLIALEPNRRADATPDVSSPIPRRTARREERTRASSGTLG